MSDARRLTPAVLALLGLLAVQGLAGCETSEGFGRDLQNLGEEIEGDEE